MKRVHASWLRCKIGLSLSPLCLRGLNSIYTVVNFDSTLNRISRPLIVKAMKIVLTRNGLQPRIGVSGSMVADSLTKTEKKEKKWGGGGGGGGGREKKSLKHWTAEVLELLNSRIP